MQIAIAKQAAKITFTNRMRREDIGKELLHLRAEGSQLRQFGCVISRPPICLWSHSGHFRVAGDPRADPGDTGGNAYPIWPGIPSGPP